MTEKTSRLREVVLDYQKKGDAKRPKLESSRSGEADATIVVHPGHETGQVLTLRSQTEKGAQQLFSGLQIHREGTGDRLTVIDGRKLPNGFDLADPATMDVAALTQAGEKKRVFGDVFRMHRNLKQLELPRTSRSAARENILEFTSEPGLDRLAAPNKQDYKFTSLPTGSWLSYNHAGSSLDLDWKRMPRSGTTDITATLHANHALDAEQQKGAALFKAAYSSFAPTSDNSTALIPESDRSQKWWRKYGQYRMSLVFKSPYPEDVLNGDAVPDSGRPAAREEDFDDIVANYEPVDDDPYAETDKTDDKDLDAMLTEISELMETLNSYQAMRSLEPRTSTSPSQPSTAEIDTFELLRSQLILLIDSLPPFAVAKLDGDQLQALNVSTRLLLDVPDYAGTSQVDDFTLQRLRAAQAATSAAGRTGPTLSQVRPNYQPAPVNPAAAYNAQARPYNAAVPATAAYGMRAATNYPTPRPPAPVPRPAYPQQPYPHGGGGAYSSQPSVQPFQRPVQNGYSYGSTPSHTPYAPRAGQPGFQPRTQESAMAYPRSASPPKPIVNGQAPTTYPSRQYSQSPFTPTPPTNASTDQRANVERMKYPRQESGTPGPPPPSGAAYGRYDGAGDPSSAASSGATQAQAQPQTIEASH